jgi:hypothetical protein
MVCIKKISDIKEHANSMVPLLAILFISLIVFKVLMQLHQSNFELVSKFTYGVIEGHPPWIAYQNRILGPYIILAISKFGMAYETAFKLCMVFMVLAHNLLLYYFLKKLSIPSVTTIAWVITYSFLLIFAQNHWFYVWDFIDSIIFLTFAWCIFQKKQMRCLVVLFFLGLLNRESALFIALYIAIDSIRFESIMRFRLSSLKKIFIGVGLLILGIIYTKVIRDVLFVNTPDGSLDVAHKTIGNHIYFLNNMRDLFINNFYSFEYINSVFILSSIGYILYCLKSGVDATIKASLIYIFIIINILVFGQINETRMYTILLPLLIFITIHMNRPSRNEPVNAE